MTEKCVSCLNSSHMWIVCGNHDFFSKILKH
jgi:hypothetical protein